MPKTIVKIVKDPRVTVSVKRLKMLKRLAKFEKMTVKAFVEDIFNNYL